MPQAEWMFHSGAVLDGRRMACSAGAVAVFAGRISAVDTDQGLRALAGPSTFNLAGRLTGEASGTKALSTPACGTRIACPAGCSGPGTGTARLITITMLDLPSGQPTERTQL